MSNSSLSQAEDFAPLVALQIIPGREPAKLVFVDHDEFTIGAGENCDLCLCADDLPTLHSRLFVQGTVIWIEAVDDSAFILVNGEAFRRRALRDGDRLTFGRIEAAIHIGEASVRAARQTARARQQLEDLSLLSAEELCDRIELEDTRVQDVGRRRRLGWQALMSAVEDMIETGIEPIMPAVSASDDRFDKLVAQVQDLSATLEARTKSLAAQEAHLMESSAQLAEVQLRVSRQLDQLLDRLANDDDQPGELRVSA